MTIKLTDKAFSEFISILEKSDFTKEEFLFHSRPYLSGFKKIINTTFNFVSKNKLDILDLGCGTGLTSYLLASLDNQVEAIDIYNPEEEIQNAFIIKGKKSQRHLWDNLEKSNHNLHFQFYDGQKFPFAAKQFDMVFCHAVLEHIPANILPVVLQEINRVLKKGGYVVIARTPNKFALTEFLAKSHDVKFSKTEILKLFEDYQKIYYQKTDFFPEIAPGKLQNFLNKIYPVTGTIDTILNKTFLEILSHHHFIILRK